MQGVVWTPPASVEQASHDLRAMAADGVQAVRTPLVLDERLIRVADTLGLQWYQDLPLAYLPAEALQDTLSFARVQLDQWLAVAGRHASLRHVGLTRLSDTSDPRACAVLRELHAAVQDRGPPGSRTYYVTPFTRADACASTVDGVLLDGRSMAHPMQRLRAWQAAHPDTPAGLGAIGTWVRADTLRGLLVPHSPEAQARYIEQHLGYALSDTVQAPPASVFAYRWRDNPPNDPYARSYGLHAADGTPRPASEVVAGFYTGTQTVFAFPGGTAPQEAAPWLTLVGWGLVGLLAIVYFRGPRFQNMASRYFGGHNFYQESVREGREVLTGSMLTVVGSALVGLAVLTIVTVRSVQDLPAVLWSVQALPASIGDTAAMLLQSGWQAGAVLAAVYGISLVLWMGGVVGMGRYTTSISGGQALMLVGAPQWPLLLVMVGALTVPSLSAEMARAVVSWLWIATGAAMLWMTGRILADVMAVMRLPAVLALASLVVSPLFMAAWVGLYLVAWYDMPVRFIMHLLTRT